MTKDLDDARRAAHLRQLRPSTNTSKVTASAAVATENEKIVKGHCH